MGSNLTEGITNPFDADFSKIVNMDDAKNLFNVDFNKYLTIDFEQFTSIIPVDYYGALTKFLLEFFLFLPGFFTFYSIKMFHDSIFTILCLCMFVFASLTFVHFKMIDEKIWYFIAIKNISIDIKDRVWSAIYLGVGTGVSVGGALILYFTYVDFGPSTIVLQMPYKENYYDLVYWAIFSVLFLVVLPLCEVLFFVIFQANVWYRTSSHVKIASFYAFYQFAWLCEVVGNWWSVLALTLASFGVLMLLIKLNSREDVFKCILVRIGLGFAVWALLVYLYIQTPKGKTKIPLVFVRGSQNNIFMRS